MARHYLASIEDVSDDGEMCICQHHLEFVAGGDSADHVANGSSDRSQNGSLLAPLVPHLEDEAVLLGLLVLGLAHIEGDVLE